MRATAIVLLLFVAVFESVMISRLLGRQPEPRHITKTDTITRIDTLTIVKPQPIIKKKTLRTIDTLLVVRRDTITDTVQLHIPISQKEYQGKHYHAYLSGYQPQLDSIKVYPRTTTMLTTIKNKWSIGPIVGVGMSGRKVAPIIGVGITYNILSF